MSYKLEMTTQWRTADGVSTFGTAHSELIAGDSQHEVGGPAEHGGAVWTVTNIRQRKGVTIVECERHVEPPE